MSRRRRDKKAKDKHPPLGSKDRDLMIEILGEAWRVVMAAGQPLAAEYLMKTCLGPLHKQKKEDAERAKRKPKRTRFRNVKIGKGRMGTFWVPEHIGIEEIEEE